MKVFDLFSMRGKVAVVTGGAGLYGRQIVDSLSEAGAKVYVASRNLGVLEEFAAERRGRGHEVIAAKLDLGDEESILRLKERVVEESGQIDVLVNNAVARTMKEQWDDTAAHFDESMHINATGLFLITRAFGEKMIEQQSGSIINIASMMGMVGVENGNYTGTDMRGWHPDYFFHKGGMINFTRQCASYYGRYGIRVNCVSPGGLQDESHLPAFVENYSRRTQLGRMANGTDLKGVILLLGSDASAYITGVNIPVDGGYTAK